MTQSQIWRSDEAEKNILITFPKEPLLGSFDNSNIVSGSFSMTQSICSGEEVVFGNAELPTVEFEAMYMPNIKGKYINIKFTARLGEESDTINMGNFLVDECMTKEGNAEVRKIVAYGDYEPPKWMVNIWKDLSLRSETLINFAPEMFALATCKEAYAHFTERKELQRFGDSSTVLVQSQLPDSQIRLEARLYHCREDILYDYHYLYVYYPLELPHINTDAIKNSCDSAIDLICQRSGYTVPDYLKINFKQLIKRKLDMLQSKRVDETAFGYNQCVYFPEQTRDFYTNNYLLPYEIHFYFTQTSQEASDKEIVVLQNNVSNYLDIYSPQDATIQQFMDRSYLCDFAEIDLSNSEWMKKMRSDWWNITGRFCAPYPINEEKEITNFYSAKKCGVGGGLYPSETLYPSNSLYPKGDSRLIKSSDIESFYVDDTEKAVYGRIKVSYKTREGIQCTATRDISVESNIYRNEQAIVSCSQTLQNVVDITILTNFESNRITLGNSYVSSVYIDLLDGNGEVIERLDGMNSDSRVAYYDNGRVVYNSSVNHYFGNNRIFETDNLPKTSKIRLTKTSGNFTQQEVDTISNIGIYEQFLSNEKVDGLSYEIGEDNLCLSTFGFSAGSIGYVLDMLESSLRNLATYHCELNTRGLPFIKAGDSIDITTHSEYINNNDEIVRNKKQYFTFAMRKTISNIQSMKDNYETH